MEEEKKIQDIEEEGEVTELEDACLLGEVEVIGECFASFGAPPDSFEINERSVSADFLSFAHVFRRDFFLLFLVILGFC